jgi:hypothetical protein
VLYRPEAFEPLTDVPWDERRVRDEIRGIAADTDKACRPKLLWPADEWDAWSSPLPLKTLYAGAAGVIWALDRLRARGYAEPRLDLAHVAHRALEAWHKRPGVLTVLELPEPARASLLMGETGILTVLWRLDPSDRVANDLYERVRENVLNPASDVMWGSPGTMLAALAMFRWTSDERWADAWRESAAALLQGRDRDGLWTQRLHGDAYRGLGPPHGVVGNVLALLQGGQLLEEEQRAALRRETAELLARTAVVEDGLANWPIAEGHDLVAPGGQIRLQWDWGAPGIVASASSYLDGDLLLAGAESTWRAGPHGTEKGSCLCHGTAGSGYAFLKAFERTEDERWLMRARSFAAHALDQVRSTSAQRGRGRNSLWTGDIGVALYAADCLDCRSAYPIIDTWDWS